MELNTVTSHSKAIILFLGAILILVIGGAMAGIATAAAGAFFYTVFIFPLGMGFAGGTVLLAAIQLAKIQRTSLLIFMSVLVAVPLYGAFHYGGYIALQVQTSFEMFSGLTPAMKDENLKAARTIIESAIEQETGQRGLVGYMLFKAEEGVPLGRFYSSHRVYLDPVLTWAYWILEFGIILGIVRMMGGIGTRTKIWTGARN
jgi:hypothetical protein